MDLEGVTRGYNRLNGVTRGQRGSQGVMEGHKGLQGNDKELQEVTKGYRG